MSWLNRITAGLKKTAQSLGQQVKVTLNLHLKLDAAARESLEEALLAADCGVKPTIGLLDALEARGLPEPLTEGAIQEALAELIAARLKPLQQPLSLTGANGPQVVLLAGVNGSGKTTTIGKLAAQLAEQGHGVVVAAADTFRAAAAEQLAVWATRADGKARKKGWVKIIQANQMGADSAGVAFQATEAALELKAEVVLIDTAGRLPNRQDLLAELPKIARVVGKLIPAAPQHVWLVLDGMLGQATLPQVSQFNAQLPLTGLVVTKLDSSGKAGFVLGLAEAFPQLPIYLIGFGEDLADLGPFDAYAFANGLMGLTSEKGR